MKIHHIHKKYKILFNILALSTILCLILINYYQCKEIEYCKAKIINLSAELVHTRHTIKELHSSIYILHDIVINQEKEYENLKKKLK